MPRKVDAARTAILVSPRNDRSAWSALNKRLVTRARDSGAMTPTGEARIAAAQANGMWSFLADVERLEVPGDLAETLGDLRGVWDRFPPNVRRGTLEWLKSARTDATRRRRIDGIAGNAAAGKRPPPVVERAVRC